MRKLFKAIYKEYVNENINKGQFKSLMSHSFVYDTKTYWDSMENIKYYKCLSCRICMGWSVKKSFDRETSIPSCEEELMDEALS